MYFIRLSFTSKRRKKSCYLEKEIRCKIKLDKRACGEEKRNTINWIYQFIFLTVDEIEKRFYTIQITTEPYKMEQI